MGTWQLRIHCSVVPSSDANGSVGKIICTVFFASYPLAVPLAPWPVGIFTLHLARAQPPPCQGGARRALAGHKWGDSISEKMPATPAVRGKWSRASAQGFGLWLWPSCHGQHGVFVQQEEIISIRATPFLFPCVFEVQWPLNYPFNTAFLLLGD